MASTHIDPRRLETSWFHTAANDPGEFDDLDEAPARDARRTRRRRQVKILGCACIATLGVIAATCLATSTAARDAIASWGTMGSVSQARLTTSSFEDVDVPAQELATETTLIAWPMGPAPAELSRDAVAETEPSVPRSAPVARPAPARSFLDDPYAGVTPPAPAPEPTPAAKQDALSDPY